MQRVAAGETVAEPLPPATVRTLRPSHPTADADTVTSGQERLVPAATTVPTARHTTSLKPQQHRSSRSTGPKRLLWALAGTAVLVAGAVGGLFLTGTLPLKEGPKTATVNQVVQSATGWQPVTGAAVQRGDQVTVLFISGECTVDHRNIPMTGPAGYDADTDALLDGAKDCKVKPAAPFGTLLAVLTGTKDFPVHSVGRRLTFRAAGNGTLQLGINDSAGACSQDNRGTLTVRVSVTHQP